MESDRFEWDDRKARINFLAHKITFDVAQRVFDDPNAVESGTMIQTKNVLT